jgi:hypothetical protein
LTGSTGPTGATGPAGPGVPVGGTAGQVLSKINSTDYNTQWIAISTSLAGLTDVNVVGVSNGQALVYDTATSRWVAGVSGTAPDDDQAILASQVFG